LGGILLAIFSLPGIFMSYFAGKLADKVGKKKILLLGLILMGSSLIYFSTAQDFILVLFFAFLISVGIVLAVPALNGLIADLAYRCKKGAIAGVWDFFMDLGYFLGPILGGLIAEQFGLRTIFLVFGEILIILAVPLSISRGIFLKKRSC